MGSTFEGIAPYKSLDFGDKKLCIESLVVRNVLRTREIPGPADERPTRLLVLPEPFLGEDLQAAVVLLVPDHRGELGTPFEAPRPEFPE